MAPKNVQIIEATARDIREYKDLILNHASRLNAPKNFCEYLRLKHNVSSDVIADISGLTIIRENLSGFDFGNVIASSKANRTATKFLGCEFKNVKFRSTGSMDGLEFSDCSFDNAKFVTDLSGVTFGKDCDLENVDFREAYNIDACTIHENCKVSNIQLGFPDEDTFVKHINKKLNDQQNAHEYDASVQAEHIARNTTVPAPREVVNVERNTIWSIGIPSFLGAARDLTLNAISMASNATYKAAEIVTTLATTNITIDTSLQQIDPIAVHRDSVKKILAANPSYVPTMKYIEPAKRIALSQGDITRWTLSQQNEMKKESLCEFAKRTKNIPNGIPYLTNVDLSGIDFSGLTFGDTMMSGCNLAAANFTGCNLNGISSRDCCFDGAIIENFTARGSDLTRCTFNGAIIDDATFDGATLIDTEFTKGSLLPTQISNATFDEVNARGMNWSHAKVTSTTANESNLQDFNSEGAILNDVKIDHSNLKDGSFKEAAATNVEITNSHAPDLDISQIVTNGFVIDNTNAPGLNADRANLKNFVSKNSDMSFGHMNQALFNGAVFDHSTLNHMQVQQAVSYKPTLDPIAEETEAYIALVEQFEATKNAIALDPNLMEEKNLADKMAITTQALEAEAALPGSIQILNSEAKKIDLQGAALGEAEILATEMPFANLDNTTLTYLMATKVNLHGASCNNTALKTPKIKEIDLSSAKGDNLKIIGGEIDNLAIEGANLPEIQVGTKDNPTVMHNVHGDDATTFAKGHFEAFDTNPIDPKPIITIRDENGDVTTKDPNAKAAQDERDRLRDNPIAMMGAVALDTVAGAATTATQLASTVVNSGTNALINSASAKKSRGGLIAGIVAGVAIGGVIAGVAASTFGLGLVPMAIVAGCTIAAGAVGGGIAGHAIQHTSKGKAAFTIASTALAATFLGPPALIVAPVVGLFSSLTGKGDTFKYAAGRVIDTMLNKPLKAVASLVSGIASDDLHGTQVRLHAQHQAQARIDAERTAAIAETRNLHQEIRNQAVLNAGLERTQNAAALEATKTKTPWTQKITKAVKKVISKKDVVATNVVQSNSRA